MHCPKPLCHGVLVALVNLVNYYLTLLLVINKIRSRSWPQNFWSAISQQPCKISGWFILTTNRKLHIASPMVTWPMSHVTPKGQSRDPKMLEAQYLNKRVRYIVGSYWLPIGSRTLQILWSCDSSGHVTDDVTWPQKLRSRPKWSRSWFDIFEA